MEDGLRNFIIGCIASMLFVFLMLSFYSSIGSNYGKDTSSLTNEYYDFSAINNSLDSVQSNAESIRQTASQGSEGNGLLSFAEGFFDGVGAFFGIAFGMFSFVLSFTDLILFGTLNIIFANPVLTATITGIIILFIIFAIFRFLKQGS